MHTRAYNFSAALQGVVGRGHLAQRPFLRRALGWRSSLKRRRFPPDFNQRGVRIMRKFLAAIGLVVAAAVTSPVNAQTGGAVAQTAPGKAGVADTVKITATITAIDKATRDITLKGPQGKEVTLTAGPEVKNFDQLKVGDQVNAQYVEALTLELKKGGGLVVGRTEKEGAAGAKPGEKPAGVVGRQVTIVADVVDVNPAKQSITLRGPQRTVELAVADPAQFKLIAKGDQVEAKYTQALAIAVQPAPKK
jgi:Cu/Ag efflux protein CusF